MSWTKLKALWSSAELIYPAADQNNVLNAATYLSLQKMLRYQHDSKQLSLAKQASIYSKQPSGHKTKLRGRGIDFDEVRRYQPGDDIRSMNWRILAKTGNPHTKLFHDERERPVLIFADYSPSMFFATTGVFKSMVASQVAALLAWLTFHHGDRLGGLVFGQAGHREIKPRRQRNTVLKFLSILDEMQKNAPREGTTKASLLDENLSRLRRITRSGSLIVLLSDFRQYGTKTAIHLERLARHNDIVLLHIYDNLEKALPPAGHFRVSDGRNQHMINTHDIKKCEQYAALHAAHVASLKALCWHNGMNFAQIATHDDVMLTLQRSEACSQFFHVT